MNTYESEEYWAKTTARRSVDHDWRVSDVSVEHERHGTGFPISGDHLTRYGAK